MSKSAPVVSLPATASSAAYRSALMTAYPVPPSMTSLMRACSIAQAEGHGPAMRDIARVESVWELIDADSTAHGFVLSLQGGRRVYLQYVMVAEDEISEEVETLPMDDERYPDIEGGGITWCDDDADRLNGLLMH